MTPWEKLQIIWPALPLIVVALAIYFGANRWIGRERPLMLLLYYMIAIWFEVLAMLVLLDAMERIK